MGPKSLKNCEAHALPSVLSLHIDRFKQSLNHMLWVETDSMQKFSSTVVGLLSGTEICIWALS